MQIPFNLDTLRLGRDRLQSLSTFYVVVKKLEHFKADFLPISTRKLELWVKFLGKNRQKLFVGPIEC